MNTNKNATDSLSSSHQVELDISGGLSEEDLKFLRKTDPFMYYSIPGARRAAIFGRTLGSSDTNALLCNNQVSHQRSKSVPDLEVADKVSPVQKIPRRSSISFEAHPDILMEDFLHELCDGQMEDEAHPDVLVEDFLDELCDGFMEDVVINCPSPVQGPKQ